MKRSMRLLTGLLLAVFCATNFAAQAYAISDEQRALVKKNILYYDLEACGTGNTSNPEAKAVGGNNVEKVINYLMGKGLSIEQAAGVVGNLVVESGDPKLDPMATENAEDYKKGPQSGVGYGLAQWTTAGRQLGLKNYAKSRSLEVYELDAQLGYLWKELKSTPFYGLDKLLKTSSVEEATRVFMDNFERPGVEHWDRRLTAAQGVFEVYKDKTPEEAVSDADTTEGAPFAGDCVCETKDSTGTSTKIDAEQVAKKHDLQSAMVKELGGETIGAYNESKPPDSPASTMKLVIADTLLRTNVDLNKQITISSDIFYDGSNDLGSSKMKISDIITKTLGVSSNVGANALVKELGGPEEFTKKAGEFGYGGTDMKAYYSTSAQGKNKSTIQDQVRAMDHLFSADDDKYDVAQNALKSAAKDNNYYGVDSEANKWAGNSKVAGNVGVFNVGGTRYIIGTYHNGAQPAAPAKNAMKESSDDILKQLNTAIGETTGSSGGGSVDESCSQVSGKGNGTVQDIVNYAIKYAWKDGRRTLEMNPEYKAAINRVAGKEHIGGIAYPGIDCGGFVTRVMRDSGADPKYNTGPEGPTTRQQAYMDEHPELYERLGQLTNASKLQPGDIAVNSGHTYLYVGKNNGVQGDSVGASLDSYAPRGHGVYFDHPSGLFTWYRLKK